MDVVTISMAEYSKLLRDSRELNELNAQGVDNWEGRDYVDWVYVETGKRDE